MAYFVPGTKKEQEEMLHETGYKDWDDLYKDIPQKVKLSEESGTCEISEGGKSYATLPFGKGEMEAYKHMEKLAASNKVYKTILRGAGAYDHYIPSIVSRVTSNERFLTAYTPYQAEISQGILQSIFEYQTMICNLTGMDVSNASVYDGAAACAEGAMMCLDRKHTKVLVSACMNPSYTEVVRTYCRARNVSFELIPEKDGITDTAALKEMITDDTACVMIQYPNYYGMIEDGKAVADIAHESGAKFVVNCNPIALGLLKTPAEMDADVAVGEGQMLGMPLSNGGPYLGFMASKESMMRKLPGRIVGETKDHDGNRAFVLTLQAREQHIKREKAGSNICSNEALCAMTAAVYLSATGPEGLENIAKRCYSNAAYLEEGLLSAGFEKAYEGIHFHEFVSKCDPDKAEKLLKALDEKDILGGLDLGDGKIIWCTTEKLSKEDLDEVIETAKEVMG